MKINWPKIFLGKKKVLLYNFLGQQKIWVKKHLYVKKFLVKTFFGSKKIFFGQMIFGSKINSRHAVRFRDRLAKLVGTSVMLVVSLGSCRSGHVGQVVWFGSCGSSRVGRVRFAGRTNWKKAKFCPKLKLTGLWLSLAVCWG